MNSGERGKVSIPLLRGGVAAPIKQMETLPQEIGTAGEVKPNCDKSLTSPAAPYLR